MEEKTQIEEKRVKSTIIRRRKTIVEEVETPPEAPIEAAAEVAAESTTVAETAEQVAATPSTEPTALDSPPADVPAVAAAPAAPPKKVSMLGQFIELPKKPSGPIKKITAAGLPIIEDEDDSDDKDKKSIKAKKGPRVQKDGKFVVDVDGIGKVSSITQLTRIVHTDRVDRVFEPSRIGKRKRIISKRSVKTTQLTVTKAAKRVVEMSKVISVADLAHGMNVKGSEVVKKLMGMGMMVTVNATIDHDTAVLIAQEFQYEVKDVSFDEGSVLRKADKNVEAKLERRPPVVTIMGHVDHGKTSLLDAIRSTNVTEGEFGGITQHIGAYTVTFPKGKITFLDTPGHEAFTAMRARGASVTDIVVLVVAADDGLMPQTQESIDHAKAAGVPLVIAVNKIDKAEADVDRIKRQLAEQSLAPEDWGGETLYSYVSAKKKEGISELLEMILLQAEILDLKADPYVRAQGIVLEARLDRNRGAVATVLVQNGTLKVGESVVAGTFAGKVRAMTDHTGKAVAEAGPSIAVEILGIGGVPQASDPFDATSDDQSAVEIAQHRLAERKKSQLALGSKVSLEDFFARAGQEEMKELTVVLKTDVHGSLEAVRDALTKLATDKVKVRVLHSGVGGITESDVLLASASNAIVIGFNVRPETKAITVSETEGVDIKLYKVIYDMVNDVKLAMRGLLTPTKKEKYLGRAEIRQTFTVSNLGTVAGCFVIDGKIVRGSHLRLLRDNVVIHEGRISTLKRFKDDAKEVPQGMECGMSVEGYQDVKEGDVIEAFDVEFFQPEL